jgi:hypothetical protein
LSVFARANVEAVDRIDEPINALSEKKLSLPQVKALIKVAGVARGWQFSDGGEKNSLEGTINVRNKHTISVTILYKVDSYSIFYKESSNMNAKISESGKVMIHPKYNEWVSNLIVDIRTQAARY